MAKQKFIPEITEEIKQVGNSMSWGYTYDGVEICFYRNGELHLQGDFPQNTVCVFNADGKFSNYAELKAPKGYVAKQFWKRGFYKGHRIAADTDPNFSSRNKCYHIDGRHWQGYEPDWKLSGYDDGWHEVGNGYYRDMYRDGKLIATCASFRESIGDKCHEWWWVDKSITKEECDRFFEDCPFSIKWDL